MREWGLEPDKDVALVSMNESANILAGMISGAVDAGVLTDPNSFAAQKAGYPLLVDLVDWPVDSNSAGFTTTRSFLQQNRPQLVSFLRGYMEGHKRFFEDRAYSIDVLRKYARIDDPEVLDGRGPAEHLRRLRRGEPARKGHRRRPDGRSLARARPAARRLLPPAWAGVRRHSAGAA
jgi:ABC-type nitrate/sulfonate/bicarbonate transport system substrate-binding protein